jgi:hypothetical protein
VVSHPFDGIEIPPDVERWILDVRDRQGRRSQFLTRRVERRGEIRRDLDAARLKVKRVFHWGIVT